MRNAFSPSLRADGLAALRRTGAHGSDHPFGRAACKPHTRLPSWRRSSGVQASSRSRPRRATADVPASPLSRTVRLSRFRRTFPRRSCAVANGLFVASGSKRRSASPARESRTRGIECSDAERPKSLSAIHDAVGLLNSAKPGLAPIGIDLARTEPSAGTTLARTDDAVEDEAVLGDIEHATGLVVDDSPNPVLYTESPSTIGKHLAVEGKPAVKAALVKRGRNLVRATAPGRGRPAGG